MDSDINWKPVCNCKQLGPLTYQHAITGDMSIIKQDDLQIIRNKGGHFRLSHHLKLSSIHSSLKNDLLSGVRKRIKIKRVFKIERI